MKKLCKNEHTIRIKKLKSSNYLKYKHINHRINIQTIISNVPVYEQEESSFTGSEFDPAHVHDFFPFLFITCVITHNKITLKHLIWWHLLIFFLKITINYWISLKYACHSAAFTGTACSLHVHWAMPEIRISVNIPGEFSGHSGMLQLTERRILILWIMQSIVLSATLQQIFASWKIQGWRLP